MLEVILKRFEKPDEVRTFEKGKFELLQVGGMTIGRATYEPGWKWSVHVGQGLGKQSCDVEHVGMGQLCMTEAELYASYHQLVKRLSP